MLKLAHYLHESSLEAGRNGTTALNAASEHWLYYKMQERQRYSKSLATHGRLVSIGTLLTLKIFGEQAGDNSLYEDMRQAHLKVGLPLSFADLSEISVEREHIVQGLADVAKGTMDCLYRDYFAAGDYALLDRVFL